MQDQVISFLQKKWAVPAIVGVASFSAGATIGYILGKRTCQEPEPILDKDVANDNQLAFDFEPEEVYPPLTAQVFDVEAYRASKLARQAEIEYEEYELEMDALAAIEEDELEDAEDIVDNIFAGNDDTWNYELELSLRSDSEPYVIHLDEYVADEMGYEQSTVTYYRGDDIMADERDVPIYDWATLMGTLKFGHGSKDPNVVYIRNERLELEWEVLLHTGRFEVEVMGLQLENNYEQEELRHSLRKFRDD